MEAENKKRNHEGRVSGYLAPSIKQKFLVYVNSKESSVSEMVAIAVQRLLESERVIQPKKFH